MSGRGRYESMMGVVANFAHRVFACCRKRLLPLSLSTTKGVRRACEITPVLPLRSPVPSSPDTSKALFAAFAERDIRFMPNRTTVG